MPLAVSVTFTTGAIASRRDVAIRTALIKRDTTLSSRSNKDVVEQLTSSSNGNKKPNFDDTLLFRGPPLPGWDFQEKVDLVVREYKLTCVLLDIGSRPHKIIGNGDLMLSDLSHLRRAPDYIADGVIQFTGETRKQDSYEMVTVQVGRVNIEVAMVDVTERELAQPQPADDKVETDEVETESNAFEEEVRSVSFQGEKDSNSDYYTETQTQDDEEEEEQEKMRIRPVLKRPSLSAPKQTVVKREADPFASETNKHKQQIVPVCRWPALAHMQKGHFHAGRVFSKETRSLGYIFLVAGHDMVVSAISEPAQGKMIKFDENLTMDLTSMAKRELMSGTVSYTPIKIELRSEVTKQRIAAIGIPSEVLSVFSQYFLRIKYEQKVKLLLECMLSFKPTMDCLLKVFAAKPHLCYIEWTLKNIQCNIGDVTTSPRSDGNNEWSILLSLHVKDQEVRVHSDALKEFGIGLDTVSFSRAKTVAALSAKKALKKRLWRHFDPNSLQNLPALGMLMPKKRISLDSKHELLVLVFESGKCVAYSLVELSQGKVSAPLYDTMNVEIEDSGIVLNTDVLFDSKAEYMDEMKPDEDWKLSSPKGIQLLNEANQYNPSEILDDPTKRNSLTRFVNIPDTITKRELSERESERDRLSAANQRRLDEVRACGLEIVQLRRENMELRRLNERISERIRMFVEDDAESFRKLDKLRPDKVKALLKRYARGHKLEKNKRKELEKKATKLNNKVREMQTLQEQLSSIQQAATDQSRVIRKMQQEKKDVSQYKATIVTQEEVIDKLERMLKWAQGTIQHMNADEGSHYVSEGVGVGAAPAHTTTNATGTVAAEALDSADVNEDMTMELQKLKSELKELKDDLKQSAVRNDALNNQLESSSKGFGSRLAKLKVQMHSMAENSDESSDSPSEMDSSKTMTELSASVSALSDNADWSSS